MSLTKIEWDRQFEAALKCGFQSGDTATLADVPSVLPTKHLKTGRACVYVQLDCLIGDEPAGWLINPFHYKGALVCFLKNWKPGVPIKGVKCVERHDRSAWVEPIY